MAEIALPIPIEDIERVTRFTRRSPPHGALTSDEVHVLMERARTCTNSKNLEWTFFALARDHSCVESDILLLAIDLDTRDSVLHAAASNPTTAALACMRPLSLSLRNSIWHRVRTHQNAAGDTAMHIAARAGVQDVVTSVYRVFHRETIPGPGDDWREEGVEFPVEEWEPLEQEREAGEHVPDLLFLTTKNAAGRDAADEARVAGHAIIAEWLDAIVSRLDPDGKRMNEEERKWMEAVMKREFSLDRVETRSCLD